MIGLQILQVLVAIVMVIFIFTAGVALIIEGIYNIPFPGW